MNINSYLFSILNLFLLVNVNNKNKHYSALKLILDYKGKDGYQKIKWKKKKQQTHM